MFDAVKLTYFSLPACKLPFIESKSFFSGTSQEGRYCTGSMKPIASHCEALMHRSPTDFILTVWTDTRTWHIQPQSTYTHINTSRDINISLYACLFLPTGAQASCPVLLPYCISLHHLQLWPYFTGNIKGSRDIFSTIDEGRFSGQAPIFRLINSRGNLPLWLIHTHMQINQFF